MDEPWRLGAAELARAIRTRRLSAREAVQSCIDRTRRVNPELNAIVELRDVEALAAADEADRAIARGDATGPLHGVPVSIKINVDQRGSATTNGLVAFRDAIATDDSPVVSNLRRAGAIPFARSNAPAFSFRWFTENDLHGRTLNPWDRARTPGGSSGGASSAVAAGMGPIAHGNDLAGSVRYPAYCTGVYGLRPSFGRVPAFLPSAKEERPPGLQMMSVQGPLARCVEDVRLALGAMSARDPRDPWWVPAPLEGPPPPRPIRVAMTTRIPGADVDPSIVRAIEQAAAWLAEAGWAVEAVEPPDVEEAQALWMTIARVDARVAMADAIERWGDEGVRRSVAAMMAGETPGDAAGYVRALARRTALVRNWAMFLERFPIVLGPVAAEPAFPYGLDTDVPEGAERIRRAMGPQFSVPLLGLPALAVPLGRAGGVPIGVQLVGARFREDLLLEAAEVLEARQPPLRPVDPAWMA
ncbi:MAG TPA: amidase family protein [Burkholderiaceae bacterium]|nr:amidase family protein [Burkholderiaceae bacterium]